MYFRRYDENDKYLERIKELFEKYKKLSITYKAFTLQEIEEVFKNKYLAKEIVNDHTYFGLIDDLMVDVSNIVKMYEISDSNILNSLYSDEERQTQKALASEDFIVETENDLLSINIMQGKLIRIALESKDNNTLLGYTQQGECKKIAAELFVAGSTITKEDINLEDEWFQEYLEALVLAGYIG
ncbi:hypothetical protein [Bacillus ndiopicus]|uniref:hypothetical protein n=1 Tax=Bacillus ndiopicus TaxID=1347368 RepID=UPI0005A6C0D2|nr:hypothetical protein [Bacillus ndiopicus]